MKFALIGAACYIAPRHMEAIKAVGGELVAVTDPHDSVGVIDKYFPNAYYFREFERFDRYIRKNPVNFVSICSPNYLHDVHIGWALDHNAIPICEKPVCLHPRNAKPFLDELVFCILQLRYHPSIDKIRDMDLKSVKKVVVDYNAPRGNWYNYSWKGDQSKSGGVIFNIGVHLFDLLCFLFGDKPVTFLNGCVDPDHVWVSFKIDETEVDVSLNIYKDREQKRVFEIDGEQFDFTEGMTELHTKCYQDIIELNGFNIKDAYPGIALTSELRDRFYCDD